MLKDPAYGYAGRILWINLTSKTFKVLDLDAGLARDYIGARGFGAKILWDHLKPGIDPYDPENKLVISLGPLAGTSAQSASRSFIAFKSPLTGTFFRSVAGGYFGAELKFAGFDVAVIEGRAEKPVYLWIHDDMVEFKKAEHLWGLMTDVTVELLKDETDKNARMFVIGPAGERLVRLASMQTDDQRSAARGGSGAVMGSKNLKAIVVRGSGKLPRIFNEDMFREAVKEQIELYSSNPAFQPFRALGTDGVVYLFYALGHFPTYNFKQLELENVERFKPEILATYVIKYGGCFGCTLRCWQYMKTRESKYAGIAWDKPEYEAQWSFGGNLGITNNEAIMWANMLCDRYGLDAISAGDTIAFAMELYEKGILTKTELDGLELRWGDPEPVIELIRKIALREGVGNILAEGSARASKIIGRGSEKFAMHAKGLELPAYDPRSAKAHGLNLATANVGASHMYGWSYFEIAGVPFKGKR